jgi:hypothetical protein
MKCWERQQKTRKRAFGDFEKLQKWQKIRMNDGGREQLKKWPD